MGRDRRQVNRRASRLVPVVLGLTLLTSGSSGYEPAGRSIEGAMPAPPAVSAGVALPVDASTTSTAALSVATPTSTTTPVLATTTSNATSTSRPAPPTTTTMPASGFGSVAGIDPATAARMTASWRPGCPVPLRDLRLVRVTHWGFDGRPHEGELVVHAVQAERIRRVFSALFEARFPIEQVRLVDEFGADDDRSMAANNTSAFNCRRARGSARWSEHAYGRAVDINPLQNPYLTGDGAVLPPGGREFVERDGSRQGVITARGPVVSAFTGIGWRWGGRWRNPDYQHFSATGR